MRALGAGARKGEPGIGRLRKFYLDSQLSNRICTNKNTLHSENFRILHIQSAEKRGYYAMQSLGQQFEHYDGNCTK